MWPLYTAWPGADTLLPHLQAPWCLHAFGGNFLSETWPWERAQPHVATVGGPSLLASPTSPCHWAQTVSSWGAAPYPRLSMQMVSEPGGAVSCHPGSVVTHRT